MVTLRTTSPDGSDRARQLVHRRPDDPSLPLVVNRPPSANSTVSGGSVGGPGRSATTTTSRRGGRTRARSPAVAVGGRLSAEPLPVAGSENPSSAAAAAAAAAKAFSSGAAAARAQWPDGGRDDRNFYSGNMDKGYPGASQWPREEKRGLYGHHMHGRYGYDRSYHEQYYAERRYRDRGVPYDADGRNRGPRFPIDYRYTREERPSPKNSRPGIVGGGTTLVLGGATPIHLPKTEVPPVPAEPPSRGTAASVFRGKAGSEKHHSSSDAPEEDAAQKILLSLRTPTSSFEEKKMDDSKPKSLSLSPADPPLLASQAQVDDVFERTPDESKHGSIDMAPSFTLFNHSFDSLGENYFNVDASLHNDSFGMIRTGSVAEAETGTQLLVNNLSNGNISTQLLVPSGSGHLTIGYSPVNSFGNISSAAPIRKQGSSIGNNASTMVLGPEIRPSSPSQVLGVYRSYSGGSPAARPGPLDDSHMRMSVGSFGAHSASYNRQFGEQVASQYYYGGPSRTQSFGEKVPPFYLFLRKYKAAFKNCTFLLPGLKAALLETPLSASTEDDDPMKSVDRGPVWGGPKKFGQGQHFPPMPVYTDPTPQDTAVARRRVESSVCAFGGNHSRDRMSKANGVGSVFRGQEDQHGMDSATVTPSPSSGSPSRSRFQSRSKMRYEEELPGRYYENESRLSWEFEEEPPVEISPDVPVSPDNGGENGQRATGADNPDKDKSDDQFCKPAEVDANGTRLVSSSPQPKMRYRCKLCGQPKQNHTCPFQQSLARSIGIMVYPAVNAFTAAEPGSIAPALSEMNNFLDVKDGTPTNESSPHRPTPERAHLTSSGSAPKQVTPESNRSSPRGLSSPANTPVRAVQRRPTSSSRRLASRSKKRSHSQLKGNPEEGDLLFMEPMDLRPQQFIAVSVSEVASNSEAFVYPALPLPYAQRKRLSDNLFSLSNEVPKLTDECAQVLREAREKDMWDVAVAELMTQVIVVIHCRDGDHRFEGLRQYLLTLGIAC